MTDRIDLSARLPGGINTHSPIGIAASHLTGDEKAIASVLQQSPGFITLKSTSSLYGGPGLGQRVFAELGWFGIRGTFASDGPRRLELLSLERTIELLRFVQERTASTPVGCSVVVDAGFLDVLSTLAAYRPSYIELNFKYASRFLRPDADEDVANYVRRLYNAIREAISLAYDRTQLPLWIKLPRDLPFPEIGLKSSWSLNGSSERLGVVAANSERIVTAIATDEAGNRLPDFAAMSGSALLPDTLTRVYNLSTAGITGIVASGGISRGSHVLAALMLGAVACQLCTASLLHGSRAVTLLHDELRRECSQRNILAVSSVVGGHVSALDPNQYH